ncbi:rrp15p domain-containing protein [Hirsutella rhossiliensis]|uniref:Rrp15p domain-containing protein n=1 Tax=Hirsutella rhossiliensis TaxID=111463 RepID=A0A9P8N243_9HYPO|nr:rrp15p domain-containing protein [Hirsutella rhossiliensis]KAH0965212.1 rrp15p domain-containing protein [Hirsutella rhossiliensis]
MAGHAHKKRPLDGRLQRPSKKQKRQKEYHSDAESEQDQQQFDAVNLLDSDDDIHNATVEDAAGADDDSSSSDQGASDSRKAVKTRPKSKSTQAPAKRRPDAGDEDDEDDEDEDDDDLDENDQAHSKPKSKRNDPGAFANSLSKILSTKLSSSKRSDPVLARSAEAHEASKAAVDGALEAKARRHLKEQKRRALEKGRVKDVLLATNSDVTGDPEASTAQVLQTERKLREVAKRGVIKMFNAVRAAQVKAAEAERDVKKTGVIGSNRREEKVNELSKKGFLDLIASGGGGLKKGALEEA